MFATFCCANMLSWMDISAGTHSLLVAKMIELERQYSEAVILFQYSPNLPTLNMKYINDTDWNLPNVNMSTEDDNCYHDNNADVYDSESDSVDENWQYLSV